MGHDLLRGVNRARRLGTSSGLVLLVACTTPPAPMPSAPAPQSHALDTPAESTAPTATATAPAAVDSTQGSHSSSSVSSPAPSAATSASDERAPFFPAPVTPPFADSAKPGDGEWTAMGDASLGELAAASPPAVFRTLIHPHPKNPFVSIELVAMDLSRLRVGWTIGKADAGAERLEPIRKPGLVPSELQPDTVAVFNGGFQARHGWWGQMTHDIAFVPAKETGCTVALREDGSVTIAPWSALAERRHELHSFRQGPPCLVSGAALHPNLEKGLTRVWAGQNPKLKTRRRSVLGIDAARRVLYFGIGTEAGPLDLARGMQAVGAHTAVQLDINFAWTRFLLVGRIDQRPRVTTSLVPDSLHGKNEYFGRASDRDFFYVYRQPE